jgi:hypothetical protein
MANLIHKTIKVKKEHIDKFELVKGEFEGNFSVYVRYALDSIRPTIAEMREAEIYHMKQAKIWSDRICNSIGK